MEGFEDLILQLPDASYGRVDMRMITCSSGLQTGGRGRFGLEPAGMRFLVRAIAGSSSVSRSLDALHSGDPVSRPRPPPQGSRVQDPQAKNATVRHRPSTRRATSNLCTDEARAHTLRGPLHPSMSRESSRQCLHHSRCKLRLGQTCWAWKDFEFDLTFRSQAAGDITPLGKSYDGVDGPSWKVSTAHMPVPGHSTER